MANKDLLMMIEAISNEKNIGLEDVFVVLEEALAITSRRRQNIDIRVEIDRKNR